MPFSTVERFNIRRHLRVKRDSESAAIIDNLLTEIEQTSEQIVNEIRVILQRLESHQTETAQAATGLKKVDVIEWQEDRMCGLYRYRKELQRELANAIGYNLPIEVPWAEPIISNNIMRIETNGCW